MIVLVINCGSSSIKYQLYDMPSKKVLAKGLVEKIGEQISGLSHKYDGKKHEVELSIPNHKAGMEVILKTLTDGEVGVIKEISEIGAVGHRVVHGGEKYSGSVLIDDSVIKCIEDFCDLAPLHNPPNLTGIREAQAALPGVPMVAVFDTAFHQTIPAKAYLYALPYELYEKYRVRKYGFHGTSHAYITHRMAEVLGKPVDETNIITCHLGNGASMAAVENGKCIDTTMGMTPLPGLVMGTRCGDIDPAIIFYLLGKEEFKDYRDIDKILNKKSGLLGISEFSNDQRDLEEKAEKEGPESRAQLALDIFAYRVSFYIGAYMGIMKHVDAIVFTGGIGENGSIARSASCKPLANVGVELDEAKNNETIRGKEGEISTASSKTKVFVIPTDEEGWIASETFDLAT
ncbi:MAG: acetate kinase [Planctomycetes bacterium]|nr:acetate kinase [Planctomycetota bacterium]